MAIFMNNKNYFVISKVKVCNIFTHKYSTDSFKLIENNLFCSLSIVITELKLIT